MHMSMHSGVSPKRLEAVAVVVALLLGTACGAPDEGAGGERPGGEVAASSGPVPAGGSPSDIQLPVSLNEVMVALVNHAADPLWVAAWRSPRTDAEWRDLERRAVQLELAGTLLEVPGTGPMDRQWAGDEVWQAWAGELRRVGAEAAKAVGQRDLDQISSVGDRIVEICEGCHIDFKPDVPTGGRYGELSPTEGDFKDEG